jgi:hypothetical protein
MSSSRVSSSLFTRVVGEQKLSSTDPYCLISAANDQDVVNSGFLTVIVEEPCLEG